MTNHPDILFGNCKISGVSLAEMQALPEQKYWRDYTNVLAKHAHYQSDFGHSAKSSYAWKLLVDQVLLKNDIRLTKRQYRRLVEERLPLGGFAAHLADYLQLEGDSLLRQNMMAIESRSVFHAEHTINGGAYGKAVTPEVGIILDPYGQKQVDHYLGVRTPPQRTQPQLLPKFGDRREGWVHEARRNPVLRPPMPHARSALPPSDGKGKPRSR